MVNSRLRLQWRLCITCNLWKLISLLFVTILFTLMPMKLSFFLKPNSELLTLERLTDLQNRYILYIRRRNHQKLKYQFCVIMAADVYSITTIHIRIPTRKKRKTIFFVCFIHLICQTTQRPMNLPEHSQWIGKSESVWLKEVNEMDLTVHHRNDSEHV